MGSSNLVIKMPLTVKMVPTEVLLENARPAVIQGWCPMQARGDAGLSGAYHHGVVVVVVVAG